MFKYVYGDGMIQIVKKPWGQEEIWAKTNKYVGKILTINPGHRLSLQYHEEKEETIYVLEGVLRVWNSEDDNSYRMYNTGSVVHISPNQVHRFGAAMCRLFHRLEHHHWEHGDWLVRTPSSIFPRYLA